MTDALSPLPREEAYTHDGYFGEERDDSVIDGPLFAEFFQRCANGCTGNELWQGITLDSSVREWIDTPFADHVHGWTPLMAAVGAGHSNTSRALLQAGADPTVASSKKDQWKPIHAAAAYGNPSTIELVLDAGASIHAGVATGTTALHLAARERRPDNVACLLRRGASIFQENAYSSLPIHYAALGGSAECAEVLLAWERANHATEERPRLVDAQGQYRRLPVHMACEKGSFTVLKLFLDLGADCDSPDANGLTPMFIAAQWGRFDCLQLLLSRGAAPDRLVGAFRRPIHGAAASTDANCVALLLQHGAHCGKGPDEKLAPLHNAALRGNARACQLLIGAGADLAATGEHGRTALHMAAESDAAAVVDCLVRCGADMAAQDKFGDTPLMLAALFGKADAAQRLLVLGASPHDRRRGRRAAQPSYRTVLHVAAEKGDASIVRLLLDWGAQPDGVVLPHRGDEEAGEQRRLFDNGEASFVRRMPQPMPMQMVRSYSDPYSGASDANKLLYPLPVLQRDEGSSEEFSSFVGLLDANRTHLEKTVAARWESKTARNKARRVARDRGMFDDAKEASPWWRTVGTRGGRACVDEDPQGPGATLPDAEAGFEQEDLFASPAYDDNDSDEGDDTDDDAGGVPGTLRGPSPLQLAVASAVDGRHDVVRILLNRGADPLAGVLSHKNRNALVTSMAMNDAVSFELILALCGKRSAFSIGRLHGFLSNQSRRVGFHDASILPCKRIRKAKYLFLRHPVDTVQRLNMLHAPQGWLRRRNLILWRVAFSHKMPAIAERVQGTDSWNMTPFRPDEV